MTDVEKSSVSKIEALGRANRTEVVALRMDPQRRFVIEMVARRHRLTVAALVEQVVDDWLLAEPRNEIREAAQAAWSPFEADRLVRQAQAFPDTLTRAEGVLWGLITMNDRFWVSGTQRPRPKATSSTFDFNLLREEWEALCSRTIKSVEMGSFIADLEKKIKIVDRDQLASTSKKGK